MKRLGLTGVILIFLIAGMASQNTLTPPQVLSKVVNTISSSKGIESTFEVTNSGYSNKGTIKLAGDKFRIELPDIIVWYNGKDMYTYNSSTEETTVVVPSVEELAESNPLAYVTNASNSFNVSFSSVKKTGSYVLELIPKSKRTDIKRITLTVKKSDYIPERIVIEPSSGNPIRADISSFRKNISVSSSEFEYPKAKYPKAEIVDLR